MNHDRPISGDDASPSPGSDSLRASLGFTLLFFLGACQPSDSGQAGAVGGGPQNDPVATEVHPHIDLPEQVIHNLGLELATVERRTFDQWIEVPGELVLPAPNTYPLVAPAHAHIVELASSLQRVKAGDVVARLHSPELSAAKSDLLGAELGRSRLQAEIEARTARLAEAEALVEATSRYAAITDQRVEELQVLVDEGQALARAELLAARKDANEAGAQLLECRTRRDEVRQRLALAEQHRRQAELEIERALHRLGILTGLEPEELREETSAGPRWQALGDISLRAPADGIVHRLHSAVGLPIDHGEPVATVLDPMVLHFHGRLPQSQFGRIPDSAIASIAFAGLEVEARLLGPNPVLDERSRSVDVVAEVLNDDWRLAAGTACTLRVRLGTSDDECVVVPEVAIVRDGLTSIVFRRNPESEDDEFEPVPLRLGRRSGGVVEVLEDRVGGLVEGDVIVGEGARQVMRAFEAKSSSSGGGGHMHADGTWHEDH